MKLVSFRIANETDAEPRIGAIDPNGNYLDLSAGYRALLVDRGMSLFAARRISAAVIPGDMVEFIQGGELSLNAAHDTLEWALARGGDDSFVLDPKTVDLLSPIPRPPLLRDFMAFETHLQNIYPKLGREIPPEWYKMPVYYKGNPGSLGADGDIVRIPSYAEELDYEFEFAIVIGKSGVDIPVEEAMDHVFGYMIYNDFSARLIQGREMSVGLGPAKGKDFTGAHVFGPMLVTKDEIPDPYTLGMKSFVNGEIQCDDNSGSMHWRFEDMIAHASMGERLEVGEVFGSGTVGNGSGMENNAMLQRGDTIRLEIAGLGVLRNEIG